MIISLIGMSGSGKTYWSQKLADQGFLYIGCDDLIEQKLEPELKKLGYSGIRDVSQWLGQPYDQQFRKNQEKYIQFEIEIVNEIFDKIKNLLFSHDNIVIDTTGSLIYTGDKICFQLQKYTTVVYLQVPYYMRSFMLNQYIDDPKPVIWKDKFNKQKSETNKQALKRCYPDLLKHREKLYEQYADISLNAHESRQNNFTINDFLKTLTIQV